MELHDGDSTVGSIADDATTLIDDQVTDEDRWYHFLHPPQQPLPSLPPGEFEPGDIVTYDPVDWTNVITPPQPVPEWTAYAMQAPSDEPLPRAGPSVAFEHGGESSSTTRRASVMQVWHAYNLGGWQAVDDETNMDDNTVMHYTNEDQAGVSPELPDVPEVARYTDPGHGAHTVSIRPPFESERKHSGQHLIAMRGPREPQGQHETHLRGYIDPRSGEFVPPRVIGPLGIPDFLPRPELPPEEPGVFVNRLASYRPGRVPYYPMQLIPGPTTFTWEGLPHAHFQEYQPLDMWDRDMHAYVERAARNQGPNDPGGAV